MKPIFEELEVNAEVIKCKECKNGKYYIYLKDIDNNKHFDIFSDTPFEVGVKLKLNLWKVTEIKYFVKKDK